MKVDYQTIIALPFCVRILMGTSGEQLNIGTRRLKKCMFFHA